MRAGVGVGMKPRFECDVCGANRETVQCNGEGCAQLICLDCLRPHESTCVERNGDRTSCDAQGRNRFNFQMR